MNDTGSGQSLGERLAGRYAGVVVWARWLVLVGWLLAAAAATMFLPNVQSASGGGGLGGLVPKTSPAVQAEITSATTFRFPLLSRVAVVQRDPKGLSVAAQVHTVAKALAVDTRTVQQGIPKGTTQIVGALPISNVAGLFHRHASMAPPPSPTCCRHRPPSAMPRRPTSPPGTPTSSNTRVITWSGWPGSCRAGCSRPS